ncbi:hypothetical protein MSG28_001277 [Choristoneura fumiferana]|uniref:Uncharacterized protein n=1 Tax=Choristoneura fumiferana TaxID=7141 RepID=A0ACC0K511_CHOFU|nr:hypothetical protein MSG28_001277 [Choristoneura fumiferana]
MASCRYFCFKLPMDNNKNELVSTVFDLKYEPHQENDFQKKEIRMPLNKGIAGYVASHGVTMNITDAYADRRFNKAVDDATGYRTTTILCMPIKVQGQVIAVVQMVNKRNKTVFNSEDEAAFKIFSTLFGLALHHARLYDQIVRNEQKYKIALEVLSYHNTCDEEDVNLLLDERKSSKYETVNYNDFLLNPFEFDDVEKCKGFLTMFDDLFDIRKFDVTVLTRFLLTVKKNYRKVPYHNFDHGWSVANAVYVILKRDEKKRFDYNSKLALFVACLCHDLDHRGYTNRYMLDIGSPLAAMYSTSTLEHHHFNITVTILQQEGHNIFSGLSSEDYKEVLDLIRQCILATDLAAFFPNLAKINKLVLLKRNFDWNDESHRSLCRSIVMTSADLSAAAKPFAVQLQTATIIQAEFFHQGDLEKLAGREPIPMMDRDKPNEQPNSQVKFLTDICLPCYKALYHLFPATRIMYDSVIDNLECWRSRARSMLLDELLSEEEYGARRQLKN